MLIWILFIACLAAAVLGATMWLRGRDAPGKNAFTSGGNHLEMTNPAAFVMLVSLLLAVFLFFQLPDGRNASPDAGAPPVTAPTGGPPPRYTPTPSTASPTPTPSTASSTPGPEEREEPEPTEELTEGPPWSAERMDVRLVVERLALVGEEPEAWSARVRVENLSEDTVAWSTAGWIFVDDEGQSVSVNEDLSTVELGSSTYLSPGEVVTGEVVSSQTTSQSPNAIDVRLNFQHSLRYDTVAVTVPI